MIQKTQLTLDNGFKLQPLENVSVEDVIDFIREYKNDLLFTINFKDKCIYIRHDEILNYIFKFDNEDEFTQVLRILPTGNIKHNEKLKYSTVNGEKLCDVIN
jgi:hypothetical protein